MKLNGSEILVNCLLEQGVDAIFGYPGGAVLNIYDALYKYKDKIMHYLTSHEQGAAHAADGYARATGRVGVCLATSGPGATNLVTGIATAYMDSVPLVAITGNVASSLLGKDSFQEIDILGVTLPITKHNFIVKDIKDLAHTIRRAFYIAQEGRPGPVLVDITKDVTAAEYEYNPEIPKEILPRTDKIREKDLKRALDLIQDAKKPYLYIGGGVVTSDANGELKKFVDLIDAPVCSSLMGMGGYPAESSRFVGMVGMHGTKTANLAVTNCDLLIAIGARFSDRVVSNVQKFATNAKILHIDIDPAEINKNVLSVSSVIGDVKEILKLLNTRLGSQNHAEWMKTIAQWKNQFPLQYASGGGLKGQYIIERICELAHDNAIITTEVGQHQMWTAQYYKFSKNRTFISSGGLGTMGFGLGASIGAKVGCPDKVVFNIAGDGCFRMNSNELATAVEYKIPVIVVVLNNHVLGMVRQWQNLFYDGRYSQTNIDRATDFVKLAEAYSAKAYHLTQKEDVDSIIKQAMEDAKTGMPVVINCEIDRDDKVFPMVAPGAGIDELITEEDIID